MEPKQGDIFWIKPLDSSTPLAPYSHPHVIIQDDVINRSRIKTLVMCALTTNKKRANEPGNILLDVGEGDLPQQSVVVVSQIETVDKENLGEYIGALSSARVQQIFSGMRFQQRAFFHRFHDE